MIRFVKSLPTICLPWIGQQSRAGAIRDRAVCADLHGSCKSGFCIMHRKPLRGLKAYKTKDGRVLLFRPEMNARRFANSNRRLCMPEMDEMFVEAVVAVANYEKD